MAKLLFASQPGMGHVNPLLSIARRLRSEGHEITFVGTGPEAVQKVIRDAGFPLAPISPPLSALGFLLLPYASGFLETLLACNLFLGDSGHYARAVGRVTDEVGPAAIVADFAFPGGHLAAEARGLPYATVYSAGLAYRGPGIPPFGSGLPIGEDWGWRGRVLQWCVARVQRRMLAQLTRARARLGLSRPAGEYFWSSPWLTLVLTSEAVEAPRHPLPAETFFVGPCFAERTGTGTPVPFDRLDGRPVVYVSLGTVFNRKPRVFERIIGAFEDGRCQLIVSAGGAYPALSRRRWPPHVHLFAAVPQVDVLPWTDAVISHGGNNTVNETLASGKPLLVLPVGGEQMDNASRVVYLKAGLRGHVGDSGSAIRRRTDRLLGEPVFRERAAECARALAETGGARVAAGLIQRLLETREPVRRPEGFPLTVTRTTGFPWGTPTRDGSQ
ncbi:MAG: glycosyltransferase family 1 protein [Armatimonadetes bacterium]|nr:glycosyltransferase family 1 protein [Armatimonadota bacterium]